MTRNDRLKLRRHALFRDLSEAAMESLVGDAEARMVSGNVALVQKGQPVRHLFVVLEGAVELYTLRDGQEATMALVRPVDFFILAGCLHQAPSPFTARTMGPSRIVAVPAAAVQALCEADHRFALAVIAELAACYYNLVQHASSLKLDTVRQRLAAYLLRLSRRGGQAEGFVLPAEKRVLASYLGMTPETLSRMFRSLRDDGVFVEGHKVRLTDPAALAIAAGEDTGVVVSMADGAGAVARPASGQAPPAAAS